jgi:hypothetical protein
LLLGNSNELSDGDSLRRSTDSAGSSGCGGDAAGAEEAGAEATGAEEAGLELAGTDEAGLELAGAEGATRTGLVTVAVIV